MPDLITNLLTKPEDIKSCITGRRKTYIEKSITGKDAQLLKEKADLEAGDGWQILRTNQKSYRLKKDKESSEVLEDILWVTAARMGFDELSNGRDFKIDLRDGTNPRQIDVFAKDRETVILIECTTCEKPQKKRMSNLIEKITSIRPPIAKTINAHFGRKPKLKIKWVIATSNVEWGGAQG